MEDNILTPEQRQSFEERLKIQDSFYRRNRKLWGLAHHGTVVVSIVSSAIAAVLPQLVDFTNSATQKNLTSILAGLTTILISLSTTVGFGKKWRACRLSNSKTRKLRNELIGREATEADIHRLNQIDEENNIEITST